METPKYNHPPIKMRRSAKDNFWDRTQIEVGDYYWRVDDKGRRMLCLIIPRKNSMCHVCQDPECHYGEYCYPQGVSTRPGAPLPDGVLHVGPANMVMACGNRERCGGVTVIRIEGAKRGSWRTLFKGVRDIREGDTVLFVALAFVPTARGGDELAPSVQASEFVAELSRIGAVGIEVYTGRSTSIEKERRAMVREASAALRNGSRRPPAGYKKVGRKGITLTAEQRREWGRMWKSKDFETNKDALAAMGDPFNAVTANKLFGPSGRPVGPRKRNET